MTQLADETTSGPGRERFEQVAREYRYLADRIDPDGEAPEPAASAARGMALA